VTDGNNGGADRSRGSVAYILKGFPRLSETFIAGEIHRIEQAGVRLHLFVLTPPPAYDAKLRHPVLDRINAVPHYLPATTSSTGVPIHEWLATNFPPYRSALEATAGRWPAGLARATAAAGAQALRTADGGWPPLRTYVKELVQAAGIVDLVLRAGDVVHLHAHYAHSPATVAWLASLITGLPFSFTAHAKDIYQDSLNPGGHLRRKLLAARFVVTCTEANVQHLRAVAPRAVIHRVYHGLNPDFARLLAGTPPQAPALADGSLRLLGVGRLVAKKGFDVLIEASGLLDRRGISFETVVVGSSDPPGSPGGGYAAGMWARIAELGLGDRVALPGAMGQEQLWHEYRRAGVFCLPCRLLEDDRDGIPNVLVEAMACGLPVVTTAVSGIPELVSDGYNGLFVPPDDAEALAGAILRLRGNPVLASRLGAAAAATVRERFDGDRLAATLAGLFHESGA
jgi:glycosyltransferase involved in cell wall biosynthesis